METLDVEKDPMRRHRSLFSRDGLGVARAEFAAHTLIPAHPHSRTLFVAPIRGSMFEYDGGNRLGPWQCAYEPGDRGSAVRIGKEELDLLIVSMQPEWLQSHSVAAPFLNESFVVDRPNVQLALMQIFANPGLGECAVVDLLSLLEEWDARKEPGRLVRSVLAELLDEPEAAFRVGRIAADLGYHPTYLARVFRRETGCSITEFAARVQLVQAARMSLETRLSLTAIAYETGFWDPSHFGRRFQAGFGMSPGQFRKRLKVARVPNVAEAFAVH